jgi:predicted DNA-binding transcriptional regulator YafY
MSRIDRLCKIKSMLQTRRAVPIEQFLDELEISHTIMYCDIPLLLLGDNMRSISKYQRDNGGNEPEHPFQR